MLALITKAQWPAPLVLGWATSASAWRYLHAEPPVSGDAINFPINVVGLGQAGTANIENDFWCQRRAMSHQI